MPETEPNQEASNSLSGNTLVCPRCVATRVAKSRLRELDRVRMQFFPARPYRCLHCYHRFWTRESFSTEKRRVWTWLIILLLLLGLIGLLLFRDSQRNVAGGDQARNTSHTQAPSGVQSSAPESVIKPVIEQPTADPEELAAVSARLEEYGWYVTVSESDEQQSESAEIKPEFALTENNSNQNLAKSYTEVTPEERESLLKVTIARRMKLWRNAWQEGDISAYLSNYSSSFVPSKGQSSEQWRAIRTQRVSPQKKIQLTLSDFEVSFSDAYQRVIVEFNQYYQSNTYLDNSQKRIVWVKEDDSWKIASEREIE